MTSITATRYAGVPAWQYRSISLLFGIAMAVCLGVLFYLLEWRAALLGFGVVAAVLLYVQPRYGLMALFAMTVIVEGNSAYSFVRPLDDLYRGVDNGFNVNFVPFSPLELGIIVVLLGAVRERAGIGLRFGPSFLPLLAVAFIFLVGLAHGIQSGADDMTGLREIRAMLYLPPLYLATLNLITEKKHFKELTVVFVAIATMMSVGALYRHVSEIRTGELSGSIDAAFSHENAIFAGLLVVFCAAMIVWAKENRTRLLLSLPILLGTAAVLVMKRRVGIIALDAGLLLLALAMLRSNFKLSLAILPVVAALMIVYLGMFWNETGGFGQGARSFRTVIGQESTAEDQSSKDYRDIEAFNIRKNIEWHPIWGSGFGHEYEFVQPLPDLTAFWEMQPFIPHNTVLWSWMKGGIFALLFVIALFGHSLLRGMALMRKGLDPLLRCWAIAATASVLMVFLFAWWDLGLVSLRVMTVFGLCLGLIAVLHTMPETEPNGKTLADPGATASSG